MRPNQPSTTAENNAAVRALESMRPAGERLCDDPYARHFLSGTLFQAKDARRAIAERIADWQRLFPGVCEAILARTRFIDDCLEDALQQGLRQLVILGAGYDTRALRFAPLKENVAVFELDHPATQTVKLERYRQNLPAVPGHVVFVAVDFDTEDFGAKLFDRGYDSTLKTFFIWEGMTYYISAAAIDRTLAFIADNAPDGSPVVFDYFPPAVADGTTPLKEARALRAGLKQLGEEFVFGLDPDNIKEFLQFRGFELVKNATMKECKRLYFTGANRRRPVSEMFVFAHARVKRA